MKFCYYLQCKKVWPFDLNKLKSSLPRDAFCQVWLKLAQWSREEDFFKSSIYFDYFVNISPWKKERPFIERPWIPFIQGYFVLSLVQIGSVVLEKKIFKISHCIFCNFIIIAFWKKAKPFIWSNLNPYTQGWFVASLVEIGLVVLEKRIFQIC